MLPLHHRPVIRGSRTGGVAPDNDSLHALATQWVSRRPADGPFAVPSPAKNRKVRKPRQQVLETFVSSRELDFPSAAIEKPQTAPRPFPRAWLPKTWLASVAVGSKVGGSLGRIAREGQPPREMRSLFGLGQDGQGHDVWVEAFRSCIFQYSSEVTTGMTSKSTRSDQFPIHSSIGPRDGASMT